MTIPRPPSLTDPLAGHPAGVDDTWRVPRRLRPAARDLPALAWLAARRCNGGPDEGDVDRYRAAAALPVWLVLLAVQQATGTLAARGRDAFVVLAPTWSAARGPYRAVKCAALVGGTVLAVLLAAAGCIVVVVLAAAGLALGVPRPAVAGAKLGLPALLVAVWALGLLAHPFRRVLTPEVGRWAAGKRTAATIPDLAVPGHRAVLATTLCGRGRPSVAAARLGRDVLALADAHGWALLTNGGVPEHTAGQYARLGFAWLPDSRRRMLRPAAGSVLVDVAVQATAELAGRAGVRVDEVRLVHAGTARAGRARGRAFVDVPAEYVIDGTVPDYALAAMAHEVGHHALGHLSAAGQRRRVAPKLTALAVLVLASAWVLAVTQQVALIGVAAAVSLAVWIAVAWLCDQPVRRQEYEADAFAVQLVGAGAVLEQLRRLQDRARVDGPWSRRLARLLSTTHPPVSSRIERVVIGVQPAGSVR